jgi:hypothetical protein
VAGPVIRSTHRDFFLARAAQARAEADQATLGHVRERCLRSEAAWQELADRAARNEATRAADEERKAGNSSP